MKNKGNRLYSTGRRPLPWLEDKAEVFFFFFFLFAFFQNLVETTVTKQHFAFTRGFKPRAFTVVRRAEFHRTFCAGVLDAN